MKCLLSVLLFIPLFSSAQNAPLWMRYPTISPDGKEIAFSYKGDLYKVDSKGGLALRLTYHKAHDTEPVWSHDGKSIAFASNRYGNFDVFIIPSIGGEVKRLTYFSNNDHPTDFSIDDSKVIFSSYRMDHYKASFYPSGSMSELYEVPVKGGRELQLLSVPADKARYNRDGSMLIFQDKKGYENIWRKHHTSNVTRDIVTYNIETKKFKKMITWQGEDRNPVWYKNDFYYLSEKSGSFNIWRSYNDNREPQQITNFTTNPVRFLSIANNGKLCFGYDGEIYTMNELEEPVKVDVIILGETQSNKTRIEKITSNATEFAVSPNNKEVAFIVHGELFVTSIDHNLTKRITNTPEQERNLSFNSKGDKLIYAGERNGSWNIYQAFLKRTEDKYFYNATIIKEDALLASTAEEFQPVYSPDDKEVAYLEERTTIKIYNLASGESRTVLDKSYNYSYIDGDQYFTWSPDSKWILAEYFDNERWNSDIGLIKATGTEKPINLSNSGYFDSYPKFTMDGEMVYWRSNREGYRDHGGWNSEADVFAIFLTNDAHKKFTLNKADYEFWKEQQEENGDDDKVSKENKKEQQKKGKDEDVIQPIDVELANLQDRKVKLTIHSSFLSDYLVDNQGEQLFYVSRFEQGYDLWTTKFRDKETKVLAKLKSSGTGIEFDKKQEHIFYLNKGTLNKVKVSDGSKKSIRFNSEMVVDGYAERAYIFEHVWRQFKKKFYVEDLHGVDWDNYKKIYAKFLPHINNGYDLAEMLSEMLGEVNASHTGAQYFGQQKGLVADQTSFLGAFYDETYDGNGLKIDEVLDKSPLTKLSKKIAPGVIIEKIDGVILNKTINYYPLLNRKSGKKVLVSFYDVRSGDRWEEVIKPITFAQLNNLVYERWIKTREADVEKLSDGRLGYVHVKGMNSASYKVVYEKVLGKYNDKEGLIVDTRFNGGGNLHDQLATFLSGKRYFQFEPRGQKNLGAVPFEKWYKPSCVLINEGNYSDAHMFPYAYKALNLGKLIGMPVAGTGTSVWWETQISGDIVFGIPEIGYRTEDGKLLENTLLEPDIKIENQWSEVLKGRDQQLEAAVKHLLGE